MNAASGVGVSSAPPHLHNPEPPIFMQPLLPPQNAQSDSFIPLSRSSAPSASDLFAQPPKSHSQNYSMHHPLQDQKQTPDCTGVSEDGYSLEFPSIEAFQHWRSEVEERDSVEFIKADTHRSKATPPRFNEHTRMVCARHCKGVRDKYAKMPSDRSRQLPSRKVCRIPLASHLKRLTYN